MAIMLFIAPANPKSIMNHDMHIWGGIREVVLNKHLWVNCLFIGCLYGPTTVFAESWGVSFTETYRSLGATDSAFLVGMIFIGLAVGCPIFGWLSGKYGNVILMRFSAIGCLVLSILIIYLSGISLIVLVGLYFLYGVFNSGIISSYSRSATLARREVSGIALGITNMSSVLLGAITIQLVGLLLQQFGTQVNTGISAIYSAGSYQGIFAILVASFVICIMLTFFMKNQVAVEA